MEPGSRSIPGMEWATRARSDRPASPRPRRPSCCLRPSWRSWTGVAPSHSCCEPRERILGRTHRMSITILRETKMPAVQVEPCFVTNPREEWLLREEAFRHDVAIAIAHGVERFFGPPGPDPAANGSSGAQMPQLASD